jgi:hypothetical protein
VREFSAIGAAAYRRGYSLRLEELGELGRLEELVRVLRDERELDA